MTREQYRRAESQRRRTRRLNRINYRLRHNAKQGRHPRETLLMVPNAPLRAAMERRLGEGVTIAEIALAAGFTVTKRGRVVSGDGRRLKRVMGTSESYDSKNPGRTYYAEAVRYEMAVHLALILGVDPVEVGV
jgi:hypothetical protein